MPLVGKIVRKTYLSLKRVKQLLFVRNTDLTTILNM